ncbi:ABC transporter ATP-binding protein [Mycoplasma marinum]|nr:ABC transporter ATP-binding protein [Mycoplasma marinum]
MRKSHSKKLDKITWRELRYTPVITGILIIVMTTLATSLAFMPYFITKIIDSASIHDKSATIRYIWIFGINAFLSATTFAMAYYFESKLGLSLIFVYGKNYFYNYMLETNAEFEKRTKGERWNDISTNLRQISAKYQLALLFLYREVIMIIASFVAIALINIYLALILVAVCILSKTILMIYDKKIRSSVKKQIDQRSKYNQELDNLINGVDTLFLYNKMDLLGTKMKSANDSIMSAGINYARVNSKFEFWKKIISLLFTSALITLTGIYILKVNISEAALFTGVILSAISFDQTLDSLVSVSMSIRGTVPLRSKKEYLKIYYKNKDENKEIKFNKMIEVDNISFDYDEKTVIKDLSFNIKKGQKKAVIGPSGCGKSTLMKILLKQLKVKKGKVDIDGSNIETLTEEQLLNNISYANNQNLILNKSFKENMLLFSEKPIEFSILKEIFNLDFITSEEQILDSNKLSTGQKQRVNLARVWAMNRSIIILDECFGNLDKRNANSILEKILKHKDRTILMISHHLTPKQETLFDDIIKMKKHK